MPAPFAVRAPVKRRAWLAQRLAQPAPLVAPGAFDAVSARLIERHGFDAVYCSGYASAASGYGQPDLGIAGFSDMLAVYRRVRGATDLPMIVDADTGYGGSLNVARTVAELAELGVTAVQIEDQVNPKQCGHLDRKEVVPLADAALRLRVAVATAGSDGPAIIARVDALAPEGLDATVQRARAYLAEGADVVLVDAVRTRDDLERIRARVDGPLMFNAASVSNAQTISPAELAALGYALVIYPIEPLYAAYGAVDAMLGALRAGELPPAAGAWRRPTFEEVNEFLGTPRLIAWERDLADSAEGLATSSDDVALAD